MDTIRITGLELDCIVGVRPAERRRRQRVRLSIELGVELARPAHSSRMKESVDYSVVVEEVASLLRFRQYRLIETATEEIAAMLFGTHPPALSVAVTLEKPEALRGRAAHGAVSIARQRASFASVEHTFGMEEILLETSEATLGLFSVAPGRSLASIAAEPRRRLGWLVTGQLGGASHHDAEVLPEILAETNHGSERAIVFCCTLREG